jgi:hypothetical protein
MPFSRLGQHSGSRWVQENTNYAASIHPLSNGFAFNDVRELAKESDIQLFAIGIPDYPSHLS